MNDEPCRTGIPAFSHRRRFVQNGWRNKSITTLSSVVLLAVMSIPTVVQATDETWPFFAFDNGIGRDQAWSPDRQAALTAKLGFDGIGFTRVEELETRMEACKRHEQRAFSFYETFSIDQDEPLRDTVKQNLHRLKETNAILWLTVQGQANDETALAKFRMLADQANEEGVRIALYPHHNTFVSTGQHALDIVKSVNRPNFGMSINVCHELKAGHGNKLAQLVKDSGDRLFLVSVNGADDIADPGRERGWARLIQPLGQGDFDLLPFLRQLRRSGYRGPIGLQGYQVPGEPDVSLRQSMKAWQALLSKI